MRKTIFFSLSVIYGFKDGFPCFFLDKIQIQMPFYLLESLLTTSKIYPLYSCSPSFDIFALKSLSKKLINPTTRSSKTGIIDIKTSHITSAQFSFSKAHSVFCVSKKRTSCSFIQTNKPTPNNSSFDERHLQSK